MRHRHLVRRLSVTALLCVLPGVLTACGGDPAADVGGAASPDPASATALTELDAAAGKAAGESDETVAKLSSGVRPEAAASYTRALGELRPAFDTFTDDYAAAMGRMDAGDVLAAAEALRGAVADFDAAVRGLDLTAVQPEVDVLLDLNEDFLTTLDAVATATSGDRAVRIMEMLPFRDYQLAFHAVADAL